MNLKKTVLTFFAATALTMSVATPLVGAQDVLTDSSKSKATVQEGGHLEVDFWAGTISFDPATVTTTKSQEVNHIGAAQVLQVNDSHAYSDGYTLQMTATDFTIEGTDYFIDSKNLSVRKSGGSSHSSCLTGNWTVNGGNTFQSVYFDLGATKNPSGNSDYAPMTGPVTLITASEGRGCGGPYQTNYAWKLNVPKGTFTDGGEAVYNGSITISDVTEVGEGQ